MYKNKIKIKKIKIWPLLWLKNGIFWDFRYFCAEKRPYFFKNSKYQKFVACDCGEAYFLGLSQFSASEIDFQASFFHFEPFFKNKNLDFGGIFLYKFAKTRA